MREVGRTIAAEAQISTGNLNRPPISRPTFSEATGVPDGEGSDARTAAANPQSMTQALRDAYYKASGDATARKIFIRNIAEEAPDSLIESLLLENGDIHYWKRTKNEAGKPVSFGTAEFVSVEGLLKAIRIIPRFVVFDKKLEVNYSEKTKGLISDFVQWRKAEIAERQPQLGEEELDEELTRELSGNDDAISRKLKLIIEKFSQHRERIVKASVTEKNSIVAATEEKLGLFKQRFGLMNEKELNEEYSRAIEAWLRSEKEWADAVEREIQEEKNGHHRKMQLIEEEMKVREEDLLPRNEKGEAAFRRARDRRAQILREDQEAEKPRIDISMQDLDRRRERETGRKRDRQEHAEEPKEAARKRVKGEVLTLQPTQRLAASSDTLEAEAGRIEPPHQPTDPTTQPSFAISIDTPIVNKTVPPTELQRRLELAEREAREEPVLVLEGRGAGAAETINKLSRKVEENKEKFENLEKMLLK